MTIDQMEEFRLYKLSGQAPTPVRLRNRLGYRKGRCLVSGVTGTLKGDRYLCPVCMETSVKFEATRLDRVVSFAGDTLEMQLLEVSP